MDPSNTSRFALSADGAGLIGKPSISTIRYSDFYGKSALNPQPPVGSGGTVQDKNGYRHHIFSSSGQFCITKSAVDGKPVTFSTSASATVLVAAAVVSTAMTRLKWAAVAVPVEC